MHIKIDKNKYFENKVIFVKGILKLFCVFSFQIFSLKTRFKLVYFFLFFNRLE